MSARVREDVITADPHSARALYASQLAVLREKAGMSYMQLGTLCLYEQSYLHRLECAQRLGTLGVAQMLDQVYGTGDLLERLWHLAKRETRDQLVTNPGPFEANAARILQYAAHAIPDLLQIRAYAQEQLQCAQLTAEQVAAEVAERMDRQTPLSQPVHYRVLVDEAALRRKARDPKTWTAQLEHLIEAAQRPAVAVQVVPFTAGPHHLRSSLELISLRDGSTVAYTQGSWNGHLTDDPEDVEALRVAFDALRDTALLPAESLVLLRTLLDEHLRDATQR
ncbi:helix-turn-helix domain-containing protein [Actinacidiphila sp. bgisy144]|uniref:helix-turn-helix domain-containing protein n=1 Tax=Actinacidiphila sp. bgisy144 TaxID=3413791 RepID=UPI003EB98E48